MYILAHLQERRYFQVAPGENARLWPELYANKITAVGWDDLNVNLRGKRKKELVDLYLAAKPKATLQEAKFNATMLSNFINLKPGDRIVSNKGRTKLLAVGEVAGYYQFQPDRKEYRHTVPVNYIKVDDKGVAIPKEMQGKFGKTIIPIKENEFNRLEALLVAGPQPSNGEGQTKKYNRAEALKELFIDGKAFDHMTGLSNIRKISSSKVHQDAYLPGMQTDISLTAKDGSRKIIIETKYYSSGFKVFSWIGSSEKLISHNLYQLYAYLKNLEGRGGMNAKCEGILLYAGVGDNEEFRFALPGHTLLVRELNLDREWQLIDKDLQGLIA